MRNFTKDEILTMKPKNYVRQFTLYQEDDKGTYHLIQNNNGIYEFVYCKGHEFMRKNLPRANAQYIEFKDFCIKDIELFNKARFKRISRKDGFICLDGGIEALYPQQHQYFKGDFYDMTFKALKEIKHDCKIEIIDPSYSKRTGNNDFEIRITPINKCLELTYKSYVRPISFNRIAPSWNEKDAFDFLVREIGAVISLDNIEHYREYIKENNLNINF